MLDSMAVILFVIFGVIFFFYAVYQAYCGLVKQKVYYPLGALVGFLIGFGIALILQLQTEWGQFLPVIGMLIGSNRIHALATGGYARVVGVVWALLVIGMIAVPVLLLVSGSQ